MPDHAEMIERLIRRARGGEESALAQLQESLTPQLRGLVERALGQQNGETAALILEETWRDVRQRMTDFDGQSADDLSAWMTRILEEQLRKVRAEASSADAHATLPPQKTVAASGQPAAEVAAGAAAAAPPPDTSPPPDALPPDASPPQDGDTLRDDYATIAPGPRDEYATLALGKGTLATELPVKTFGDFDILGTIARGGMGVVYKARQRKLNRTVALKMILAGQFADQQDVDRFYSEAEAAANLRHPNIVGIHEVGECEGQHYFSMDYIEGQSLADLVREQPLPVRQAAEFVKTVADAMHYAHTEGVLHRDLKPSNVLVDAAREPLVTDFGLAKRAEGQSQLTMSGTIIGTPSYMPPEQASGQIDEISVRSDVYSLGAILYELLTGKPPFAAGNPFETIKQVLENEPLSPRLLNPGVPVDLETICLKCLQKEPPRRYESALQLREELERFLAGEPILARPVGPAERFWRWCRRNPRIASLTAAAAVGFVAAFLAISLGYVQKTSHLREKTKLLDEKTELLQKTETARDQLLGAIKRLYTLLAEEGLLNVPGAQDFRRKLLADAETLYAETLVEFKNDPTVQHEYGLASFLLGRIILELDEPGKAIAPLEEALEIQRKLHAEDPGAAERMEALGDTLNLLAEARQYLSESEELSPDEKMRAREEALAAVDEAIQLRSQLVRNVGETAAGDYQRLQLSNSHMNRGLIHKAMADELREQAQAADPEQPPPPQAREIWLKAKQNYDEAVTSLSDAQARRGELQETLKNDAKFQLDLAKGCYNLAVVSLRFNELGLPGDHLGEAETQLRKAVEGPLTVLLDPATQQQLDGFKGLNFFEIRYLKGASLANLGTVNYERAMQLPEADPQIGATSDASAANFQAAIDILRPLAEENREVHKYQGELANAYYWLGVLRGLRGDNQKAADILQEAINLLEPLVNAGRKFHALLADARGAYEFFHAEAVKNQKAAPTP